MLSRGKRYEKGRIIYAIFAESQPFPLLYAKISRDPSFDFTLQKEWTNLKTLRELNDPILNNTVPAPLDLIRIRDRLVLFESSLQGRTMLHLTDGLGLRTGTELDTHTRRLINLVEEWLHHLHRATKLGTEVIRPDFCERRGSSITDQYLRNLGNSDDARETCSIVLRGLRRFEGVALPLVMTNGNLAPQTILVDDQLCKIGVVDWKFSEWTSLPLREYYCFSQYLFYAWFVRGFLGQREIVEEWIRTFLVEDSYLGKLLSSFTSRVNQQLGIETELADFLFALFLMNEVNIQIEHSKFIPDVKAMLEQKFLDLWMNRRLRRSE